MSHCTKFDFQYTSRKCIVKTFEHLGLDWSDETLYKGIKIGIVGIPLKAEALMIYAKKNDFQYFMVNKGHYYELIMEKHNPTADEKVYAERLSDEFQKAYIGEVAKEVAKNMEKQGQQAIVEETSAGYQIRFGLLYDKNILIKFENGRVIEEVKGVKGQSCVSLTEALENMMSSQNVELQSEWTEEYYEDPGDELTIYNMDQI